MALTVAALSQSFVETLNPLVGLGTIQRMGAVYWSTLFFYADFAVAQSVVTATMGQVPILGGMVNAVVNAYAALAIGCTLGLAVFKRAPELGLE